MYLTLNNSNSQEKSRLALITLANLNLRIMENWRLAQLRMWGRTFDHDSTLILVAIVAISAENLSNGKLEPALHNLANAVPYQRLRRCTFSSIAATTNINRETVRRKINQLEAAGVVIKQQDGSVHIAHGILQRSEVLELVRNQLAAVHRAALELMKDGVMQRGLEPNPLSS